MFKNRWLIVFGWVLLVAMLLAGAFSLGVYVGESGCASQGLQGQPGAQPRDGQLPQRPPGAGQSPPGQPLPGDALPDGLPPWPPQLVGRVRVIAPDALELATPDGRRLVRLLPETRYMADNGDPRRLEDLRLGVVVGVHGRLVDGSKPEFLADVVVLLPPK